MYREGDRVRIVSPVWLSELNPVPHVLRFDLVLLQGEASSVA